MFCFVLFLGWLSFGDTSFCSQRIEKKICSAFRTSYYSSSTLSNISFLEYQLETDSSKLSRRSQRVRISFGKNMEINTHVHFSFRCLWLLRAEWIGALLSTDDTRIQIRCHLLQVWTIDRRWNVWKWYVSSSLPSSSSPLELCDIVSPFFSFLLLLLVQFTILYRTWESSIRRILIVSGNQSQTQKLETIQWWT